MWKAIRNRVRIPRKEITQPVYTGYVKLYWQTNLMNSSRLWELAQLRL